MTPAFITVTLDDEGGSEVIDLLDISRLARARGAAKGARIRFKDGTTIDVRDDAKRITDALRDIGRYARLTSHLATTNPATTKGTTA